MLAIQRHRRILDRIETAGSARVTQLAKEFGVTEETIRRDLEKLDADGKVIRTHGGALPVENTGRELPYDVRKAEMLAEKQAIAKAGLRHVAPGDVIAIDSSSTAFELACCLPDVPVTVVTNAVEVAAVLVSRPQVRVVSTGGRLDRLSRSYLGPLAELVLEHFNVNKLFLSSKGVDARRGLSVADDDHARIKRLMMDRAERTILLADHSKFGVRSAVFFADLKAIDTIITDVGADERYIAEIRAEGLTVETIS